MNVKGILATLALFGLIGVGFIWNGAADYFNSRTASATPSVVELADLEAGNKVENNNVRIGSHRACYYATVYSYHKRRLSFKKPDAETSVSDCYYPIVSGANPAVKKIEELEKEYGSLDDVPDSVDIEPPTRFAVVVKTKRFKKVGDIPEGIPVEQQVQGLVLNRSNPLSSKEKKLLGESFPAMNFDSVLVLEEGRTPSSALWCITMIGLGLALILMGMGLAGLIILRGLLSARTK